MFPWRKQAGVKLKALLDKGKEHPVPSVGICNTEPLNHLFGIVFPLESPAGHGQITYLPKPHAGSQGVLEDMGRKHQERGRGGWNGRQKFFVAGEVIVAGMEINIYVLQSVVK